MCLWMYLYAVTGRVFASVRESYIIHPATYWRSEDIHWPFACLFLSPTLMLDVDCPVSRTRSSAYGPPDFICSDWFLNQTQERCKPFLSAASMYSKVVLSSTVHLHAIFKSAISVKKGPSNVTPGKHLKCGWSWDFGSAVMSPDVYLFIYQL